ncbi:MAG: hypothetical protein ACK4NS_05510 [Saprospiraceae bacterium]
MPSKVLSLLLFTAFLLQSCSAEKQFARRLTGEWAIERYAATETVARNAEASALGSIRFRRNGTGEVRIKNILIENQSEDRMRPFRWGNTENTVTISGDINQLSKVWIVIENRRRTQVWKSTDGANTVQELRLAKALR